MKLFPFLLAGLAFAASDLSSHAASPLACQVTQREPKIFRAGASAIDIAPARFPVLVNGGFLQSQASQLKDPIHAKCIVLDDGSTRLAIVVVDSCMMPRDLLDRAKTLAHDENRHPHRTDPDLRDAHPLGAGGDGCAGLPGRCGLCRRFCRIGSPTRSTARLANLEPARIGWNARRR